MKEFEQLQNCSACNENRFGIKNGEIWRKFDYEFCRAVVIDGVCARNDKNEYKYEVPIAHMHITCQRCGYKWLEGTAFALNN
jgi:hypothetical protein